MRARLRFAGLVRPVYCPQARQCVMSTSPISICMVSIRSVSIWHGSDLRHAIPYAASKLLRSRGFELSFPGRCRALSAPESRPFVGCEDHAMAALGRGLLSGRLAGRMRWGQFLERSWWNVEYDVIGANRGLCGLHRRLRDSHFQPDRTGLCRAEQL